MLARRLGLDPAEVRRRNLLRAGEFPHTTAAGPVLDSGSPAESLERVLELGGLRGAARPSSAGRRPAGCAGGSGSPRTRSSPAWAARRSGGAAPSTCRATTRPPCASSPPARPGPSSARPPRARAIAPRWARCWPTSWACRSTRWRSSRATPSGAPTAAARSRAGRWWRPAARWSSPRAPCGRSSLRIAAGLLEAAPEDLVVENGEIAVRGAPSRRLAVREVAVVAHRPAAGLPPGIEPGLEATRFYDPPPPRSRPAPTWRSWTWTSRPARCAWCATPSPRTAGAS